MYKFCANLQHNDVISLNDYLPNFWPEMKREKQKLKNEYENDFQLFRTNK